MIKALYPSLFNNRRLQPLPKQLLTIYTYLETVLPMLLHSFYTLKAGSPMTPNSLESILAPKDLVLVSCLCLLKHPNIILRIFESLA